MQRRDFCKLIGTAAATAALPTAAQAIEAAVPIRSELKLPVLGKVKLRSSREISSSNWSIGGETLDRGFAVYRNYKKFIGPLGAKGIRLQSGWAKCEKSQGIYDWAWLDEPVDDARAQGVQPWLQLSFGNPIYHGGGNAESSSGFPSSPEALAAWDRWVRATVEHYKDRIHEWEIWNEPDLWENGTTTVAAYIELYIRTAAIIRSIQPKGTSQIYALALCYKLDYAYKFLNGMAKRKKLDLVDALTVHTYPENPDDTQIIDKLREKIDQSGHFIAVRQGETGAPSKYQKNFALRNLSWTENMQAKWDLRRMLAHHGKDVPFSLFTIMDLHYRANGQFQMNYKGLLAAQKDPTDLTVAYAKPAYYAAQNVFSIFDDSLERVTKFSCTASATESLAAYAYRNRNNAHIVTLWFNGASPSDSNSRTPVDIMLSGVHFEDPIYVDLLTGKVFKLPGRTRDLQFKQVPLYDSPIMIAERKALSLE